MVEGGATLNFELMRLGLVDELTIYIAPMIFGGEMAPTIAAGSGSGKKRRDSAKASRISSMG